MEQQTKQTAGQQARPTLTILERADDRLFETFDVDRPGELSLFEDAEGTLFATGPGAEHFVTLTVTETGLATEEVADVSVDEMEEVEVTEPQETEDVSAARTRMRGD